MKKSLQQLVGNDVVDLLRAASESNWKRPGYLNKLLSTDEQCLIHDADNPSLLLWLMWTMKESAYKIVNRVTGIRTYAPLSFSCKNLQLTDTEVSGEVTYQYQTFYTKSVIKQSLIHSIAVLSANDLPAIRVHHQRFADSYLSDFNQLSTNYALSKNKAGLPELTEIHTGKKHAVSISHHGQYLAIAYSDSPLSTD